MKLADFEAPVPEDLALLKGRGSQVNESWFAQLSMMIDDDEIVIPRCKKAPLGGRVSYLVPSLPFTHQPCSLPSRFAHGLAFLWATSYSLVQCCALQDLVAVGKAPPC